MIKFNNSFILSALVVLLLFISVLQANDLYTSEQLKADLDTLYVMIDEIHPNMYAYITQEEFEERLGNIREQITGEMSKLEFYRLLSPLVAVLGDGHTSLAFPFDALGRETKLLPFELRVNHLDSTAVVIKSFLDEPEPIPGGSVIMSINERNVAEIIADMFSLTSGELLSFKAAYINRLFRFLLYALYAEQEFIVNYSYEDELFKKEVPGLTHTEIWTIMQNEGERDKKPPYYLTIEENDIAVIHFNSFVDVPRFTEFIDSVFTVIKEHEIEDLIIDIRDNGGGHSGIGDEFFQYISPAPFNQYGSVEANISPRQIEFHENAFGYNYDDVSLGPITYDVGPLQELRENPLRFYGNTYLLTSNFSFSSAADFAWTFQYFNMGTIIGQETGGLPVCYGDIIVQQLPNSQLTLNVSFKKFYNYGATDDIMHGTIPDFQIPADDAMAYAIRMIEERKQENN